jgi:hypothetical protein
VGDVPRGWLHEFNAPETGARPSPFPAEYTLPTRLVEELAPSW